MAGFTWKVPPQDVWPQGTAAYIAAIKRGVHGVMKRYEAEILTYMRTNAPWEDKTGAARQTLYTEVNPPTPADVIKEIELIMAHGVFYGWYLENFNPVTNRPMMRPPRWQIIEPTLDYFGPRIWNDIQRLFR